MNTGAYAQQHALTAPPFLARDRLASRRQRPLWARDAARLPHRARGVGVIFACGIEAFAAGTLNGSSFKAPHPRNVGRPK